MQSTAQYEANSTGIRITMTINAQQLVLVAYLHITFSLFHI